VLRDAFLDVGVEFESQCFALFGRFREVHLFGAFGFGHCWRLVERENAIGGGRIFLIYSEDVEWEDFLGGCRAEWERCLFRFDC